MAEKDRKGRVLVSVRLPEALAKRLEEESDQRVVGKDLLVQKALEAYLAAIPPMPEETP